MPQGAHRCSICSINYPPTHSKCVVCHEELSPMSNAWVHSDWERRVREKNEAKSWYEEALIPNSDAPLIIVNDNGRLRHFFEHDKLVEDGYRYLEPGAIILVHGLYYELAGYISKDDVSVWWVEPLDIEEGVRDILENVGASGSF